ncbi:SGNH/GDSL hydrolase family protein [Elusimicrobiota bacterium]
MFGIECALIALEFTYYLYYERIVPLSATVDDNSYKILCIGESYVEGMGASDEALYSFPMQLEKMLKTRYPLKNISVYNLGIGGVLAERIFKNMDFNLNYFKPDIVILLMSHNLIDTPLVLKNVENRYLFKTILILNNLKIFKTARLALLYLNSLSQKQDISIIDRKTTASMLEQEYPATITYDFHNSLIQEPFTNKMTLAQYNSIMWTEKTLKKLKDTDTGLIFCNYFRCWSNEQLRTIALKHHVLFCDNESVFKKLSARGMPEREIFSKDMWHPSDNGYRIIAENLLNIIEHGSFIGQD